MIGVACLIVADLILAFGATIALLMTGVVFWGLHMALTQGLFASVVADTAPENLRGMAFGIFNFAGGVALLLASIVAGGFWDATVQRRPSLQVRGSPLSRWSVLSLPKGAAGKPHSTTARTDPKHRSRFQGWQQRLAWIASGFAGRRLYRPRTGRSNCASLRPNGLGHARTQAPALTWGRRNCAPDQRASGERRWAIKLGL